MNLMHRLQFCVLTYGQTGSLGSKGANSRVHRLIEFFKATLSCHIFPSVLVLCSSWSETRICFRFSCGVGKLNFCML